MLQTFSLLNLSRNSDFFSLRCSKLLAYDGIHFGNIMREIAKEVGGTGGGHAIACGAYIPNEKKSEFLDKFNKKLQGKIAN